jgi:hypothetical protein
MVRSNKKKLSEVNSKVNHSVFNFNASVLEIFPNQMRLDVNVFPLSGQTNKTRVNFALNYN